jgi:hypothetical protein
MMPNRLLKESICTSEEIDKLTAFQETCFYRLIVTCDDFGRFDARPKVLKSRLFPLKNVSPEEIFETVKALAYADLVTLYYVAGKPFLQLKTWANHQQVRAKRSKYPSPAEGTLANENICNQMISDDIKCPRNPIQSNTITRTTTSTESNAGCRDEDLIQIQKDHNDILNAAQDAGFPQNQATFDKLIDLYADYGKDIVLAGISACVDQSNTKPTYLKACCRKIAAGDVKPEEQDPYLPKDHIDYGLG